MGNNLKCQCCGEKGELSQAPWPLPISTCHCNDCYVLESIAFSVWRELNPTIPKVNAPVPFLKSKDDYPPDTLKGYANKANLREWFRSKLVNQNEQAR